MKRFSGPLTLLLGLFASALAFWLLRQPAPPPDAGPGRPPFSLPVTITGVARGTLQPRIRLSGAIRAPERTELAFEIEGRILELLARDADPVEKGQVLARLDPRDAEQALVEARAAVDLSQAQLAKLEAGERSEVVAELEAELATAEADLALAELEVKRSEELLGAKVTSQSAYDRLVAERNAAKGRAGAALQRLNTARTGSRAEDIQIAKAELETRRAALARAQLEREKVELRAPYDGVVIAKLASVGAQVQPGEPVYEVIDTGTIEAQLVVPAQWIERLAVGGEVILGLDSDPSVALPASISAIVPAADSESRNFAALVRLDGGDPATRVLRPGSFVRADVALAPIEDTWLVAADAVLVNDKGTFLVRAADAPPQEGPKKPGPPPAPWVAEWVPVRVLARTAAEAAVEPMGAQLAAPDRIVRTGVDRAFPGTALIPAAERGGGQAQSPGSPSTDGPPSDAKAPESSEDEGR